MQKGFAEVSERSWSYVHGKGDLDTRRKFDASRTCHIMREWAQVRGYSRTLCTRLPGTVRCLPASLIFFSREISGRNTEALITLAWLFPLHFTSQWSLLPYIGKMLCKILQMRKSIGSLLHRSTQPHKGWCRHKGKWLGTSSGSSTCSDLLEPTENISPSYH